MVVVSVCCGSLSSAVRDWSSVFVVVVGLESPLYGCVVSEPGVIVVVVVVVVSGCCKSWWGRFVIIVSVYSVVVINIEFHFINNEVVMYYFGETASVAGFPHGREEQSSSPACCFGEMFINTNSAALQLISV